MAVACDRVAALETSHGRFPSFFLIELGAHCGRYGIGGAGCADQGRGWEAEAEGGREVGFIRLVTDTTYCIGHKSSYPCNLSFK